MLLKNKANVLCSFMKTVVALIQIKMFVWHFGSCVNVLNSYNKNKLTWK